MTVLSGLIPVFALLALGVAVRRLGLLSGEAANGLNRLVANVALPALLLLKIGTSPLKVAVQPALMLVVLRALGLPPLETAVGVLLMAAPTAVATYPVAAELGGDTNLAGACVVATTLAALPAYTLFSLLLAG